MGIHDRHYIRDRPEPGFGSRSGLAIRGWSVTTWIIVICVAVFVIDGFLPHRLVATGRYIVPEGVVLVLADTRLGPIEEYRPHPRIIGLGRVSVYHRETGEPIAVAEVYHMRLIESYMHFSTQRGFLQIEFWRLIGFQFLHSRWTPLHIAVNMLVLFFFAPMVERHLGSKRFLAFYLLCGICGALLYSALNLGGWVAGIYLGEDVRVPGLLFNDPTTPLIGASAGVFGVLMAAAYLAPEARVLLFFIIPMRLRTLAYLLVGIALLTVLTGGHNAGGEAGHLGGALAGFYFIRRQRHLHGFFDFLGWADPTSHHYRKGKAARAQKRSATDQREVDRILDKISRDGIQSLTDQEKRILREASRG